MLFPNDQIFNKIRSEVASLFYVPISNGKETALLIKAPTPAIKAITLGCPVHLQYGVKDSFLCIGVKIEDVPDSPLLISAPQIASEEQIALKTALRQCNLSMFLYNEMDICIASSSVYLNETDAQSVLDLIADGKNLYSGDSSYDVSFAHDCFVFSIDPTKTYSNAFEIPIIEVTPIIAPWKTNIFHVLGDADYHTVNITSPSEGKTFESTVWSALEPVFHTSLYSSPDVQHGTKWREFTDVFAHYKYGSFIIEAKDLSVIQAGFDRSTTKRLSGIQKQVEKAIKQLVGASKSFGQGEHLQDCNGKEIIAYRTIPPHCIVLITELMESGDWDAITKQLLDAIQQTGAFFHLMDFREFITLLKQSSGKPELIDYNLIERCKFFIEKKSVFIRGT